ncbi:MAG: tetratricopeptide repeat protein, partial [Patescibacteria group bacterium]
WNVYHPTDINQSIFWNVPFETGYNLLQSMVTTNGLLPSIAFIVVLVLTLVHGFRLFNCQFPDRFTRFIAVASLIMTIATVSLFLFGSPGIVLIVFGFTYVGLLFGVSSLVGKTKVVSIEYLKDPRLSFFAILLLVVASMVGFSAVYFTGNRFASMVFYNKALAAQDVASAERNLVKAISLSNSSLYWKAGTVLLTRQFQELAATENADKTQLQNLFTRAEQSAQTAVALDAGNAASWLDLSQVYQLVAGSGNTEAVSNAKQAAIEAEKRNPNNPLFKLNNARIALLEKDNAAALAAVESALALKPNYLDAFIFRGQMKRSNGETNAIRDELLKYVSIAPSDDQGYSLLGSVYLEAKNYEAALTAFGRARNLAPNNPNYYLSYITTLEMSGEKTKAIEELNLFKTRFPNVSGVDDQISRLEKNTPATTSTSEAN